MNFKELEISDELLCEILGCDVVKTDIKDNTLEYDCDFCDVVTFRNINIYELAFKCKEWAKNKEYIVHSSPTQKIEHTAIVQSFDFNKFYYGENQFYALTEIEAIIKACEWILENSK